MQLDHLDFNEQNFYNILLISYRVMGSQTLKIRPKFTFKHGGFSQRQSHMVAIISHLLLYKYIYKALSANLSVLIRYALLATMY